jgi:hypothetical protein
MDPHSFSKLDPDPVPHKVNADPKHWFRRRIALSLYDCESDLFSCSKGLRYTVPFKTVNLTCSPVLKAYGTLSL